MATPTYELIETTTLTSSASSVTFTSITQDYRDLVVVTDASNSSGEDFFLTLNADTSNYTSVRMRGNGSSAFSRTQTTRQFANIYTDASNSITQIMDYSATDKHKTILSRSGLATSTVWAYALRYASTSAITSVKLEPAGGTLNSGSTFSLYGIAS